MIATFWIQSPFSDGPLVVDERSGFPLAVPVRPHQFVKSLPLHRPCLLMMSGTPIDRSAAYTQLTEQFIVAPDADPHIRALDVSPRQFQFDSVDRHAPTVKPHAMLSGGSHQGRHCRGTGRYRCPAQVPPSPSLLVPSGQMVLLQTTSMRFALLRLASVRLAPARSAVARFAPLRFAPFAIVPTR